MISTPSPSPETEQSPCPTPLSWEQVLRQFVDDSEVWDLSWHGSPLRGRRWGSGRPLYLLNGLTGTCELYALLAYLLKDDFCCVLFNYPDVAGRLPPEDYAAMLRDVAFAQGHRRFAVYASTFGCIPALELMLQHPECVETAILQSGFARRRLSWLERALLVPLSRSSRQLSQTPGFLQIQTHNHRRWFPPFDFSRWQFYLDVVGRASLASVARRAATVKSFDVRDRLCSIRTPCVLIDVEGAGPVSRRAMEELAAGLPTCRVEELHTCGDLPYLTHPHRLRKIIEAAGLPDLPADVPICQQLP